MEERNRLLVVGLGCWPPGEEGRDELWGEQGEQREFCQDNERTIQLEEQEEAKRTHLADDPPMPYDLQTSSLCFASAARRAAMSASDKGWPSLDDEGRVAIPNAARWRVEMSEEEEDEGLLVLLLGGIVSRSSEGKVGMSFGVEAWKESPCLRHHLVLYRNPRQNS